MLCNKYIFRNIRKLCIFVTAILVVRIIIVIIPKDENLFWEEDSLNVPSFDHTTPLVNSRIIIAPNYRNGSRILEKDVTLYWNRTLQKWNSTRQILTFIHIGKAGGTSLAHALSNSVLTNGNCRMKCVKYIKDLHTRIPNCQRVKPIICQRHFDWTIVREAEDKGLHVAPIILFRDPIQRTVSNFHFAKTLEWTKDRRIREQNLTEYLNDKESMMNTFPVWYDGVVGFN